MQLYETFISARLAIHEAYRRKKEREDGGSFLVRAPLLPARLVNLSVNESGGTHFADELSEPRRFEEIVASTNCTSSRTRPSGLSARMRVCTTRVYSEVDVTARSNRPWSAGACADTRLNRIKRTGFEIEMIARAQYSLGEPTTARDTVQLSVRHKVSVSLRLLGTKPQDLLDWNEISRA